MTAMSPRPPGLVALVRDPWLAHPTAWHLSRELPTDVLICPVV